MATRSGWEGLSSAYRSRLIGAGRSGKLAGQPLTEADTRRYWESGASLRTGRSHAFGAQRPRSAAPAKATRLEERGMGTPDSYSQLRRWRQRPPSRGGPPAWIGNDETELRTDVAAILSQIDIPIQRWRNVTLTWLSEGKVALTVISKRGATRTVILPDTDAAKEVGRLLKLHGPEDMEVEPHGSPGAKAA